ncbi:MAG TPA: 1-phosphofructokinase family hexose kinase [Acidimicrobiales bacterium]|nr:1-phosphofructokinase family hexose kinase [Acidimicrobiales bacterium]
MTLTLNPSLDRTVEVPGLVRGSVIRASGGRVDPGGKGVNVARALLANGVAARAVLPAGGPVGRELVELLDAEGVAMTAVPVAGATRSNLTLSEPDGTVTKINEGGARLDAGEIDLLADAVVRLVGPGDWAVLSGSLPTGVATDVYARLTERFVRAGLDVALDTSGPALVRAVQAGPTIVKPNRDELSEALGRDVRSLADAVEAAELLRSAGAAGVLASLGPDGAVLVGGGTNRNKGGDEGGREGGGVVFGDCVVAEPRSSVGAGDCLLAGYLAARSSGAGGHAALATALRWAAAAVELPGSAVPGPADVARHEARLTDEVDRDRVLTRSG